MSGAGSSWAPPGPVEPVPPPAGHSDSDAWKTRHELMVESSDAWMARTTSANPSLDGADGLIAAISRARYLRGRHDAWRDAYRDGFRWGWCVGAGTVVLIGTLAALIVANAPA